MSKNNQKSNSKPCVCSVCNAAADAPAGKTHRRCSGQPNQPIRPKHDGTELALSRGRWQ